MYRIPVFEVKETQPLAEHVRFVVVLHPEPLPGMHATEAMLKLIANAL